MASLSRTEVSDAWRAACAAVGVLPWSRTRPEGLRIHALRYHAGTMAARSGATTKELMRWMGHRTPRATLTYQHATDERDQAIAEHLEAATVAAGRSARPAIVELPRDMRAMDAGS